MQLQFTGHGSALNTAIDMREDIDNHEGSKEMVEFLVKEAGADVNLQVQFGSTGSALVAAIDRGNRDIVEFLVREGGADVNMQVQHGKYGSALVAAGFSGEYEIVKFLVNEGGADVNLQVQ
jgi:ankyrin repeat protein